MEILAKHVIEFYSVTWSIDDHGKIHQTPQDLMNPEVSIFTETARAHNLMLYFQ